MGGTGLPLETGPTPRQLLGGDGFGHGRVERRDVQAFDGRNDLSVAADDDVRGHRLHAELLEDRIRGVLDDREGGLYFFSESAGFLGVLVRGDRDDGEPFGAVLLLKLL